jgi:hypothetical protein
MNDATTRERLTFSLKGRPVGDGLSIWPVTLGGGNQLQPVPETSLTDSITYGHETW